jgi:hypothetical protein
MEKAPTALQALKALPRNVRVTYRSRLKNDSYREAFDECVAELKAMPADQRPSTRVLAAFFEEQFGVKPSVSTVCEWMK